MRISFVQITDNRVNCVYDLRSIKFNINVMNYTDFEDCDYVLAYGCEPNCEDRFLVPLSLERTHAEPAAVAVAIII